MKICRHCKVAKGVIKDSEVKSANGKVYSYYSCRLCNSDRRKRYYRTVSGKISIKESVKKYEQKNYNRRLAWGKARSISLDKCSVVGCKSMYKSHRHHPNPNNPLEIVILCPFHHKQADSLIKNAKLC